jgi:hypothetical protein
MESLISNFWWGSNVDKRKIHWVNWRKTCKAKSKGGMGFKDLRAFNEALLAKQGWRLITKPSSLIARIFKAKYYPNCDFLKAKQSQNTSYSWHSIIKASWILKKGCLWNIGDGKNINIWEDKWFHKQFGSTIWSKKPDNTNYLTVSDLIDDQNKSRKEQTIHQIFYPSEADQICTIPLTSTDQEDFLNWQGTKDGNYSVKSGYQAVMDWNNKNLPQSTSNHYEDHPRWKKTMESPCSPKADPSNLAYHQQRHSCQR